jgi:hypothetical protein
LNAIFPGSLPMNTEESLFPVKGFIRVMVFPVPPPAIPGTDA